MEPARLGRYEVVAELAIGGMGRVSLARARGEGGFERHVVIKSLDRGSSMTPWRRAGRPALSSSPG